MEQYYVPGLLSALVHYPDKISRRCSSILSILQTGEPRFKKTLDSEVLFSASIRSKWGKLGITKLQSRGQWEG